MTPTVDPDKYPLLTVRSGAPALKRTRFNVYDLVHYLECGRDGERLADAVDITVEEIDALKAYLADHREAVMDIHRQIEERIERQSREQAEAFSHIGTGRLERYRDWMRARRAEGRVPPPGQGWKMFAEWEARQNLQAAEVRG